MATTTSAEPALDSEADGLYAYGLPHQKHWKVVTSKPVNYEVRFRSGLLDPGDPTLVSAGAPASHIPQRRLLVVETQVHALYGERISAYFSARSVAHEFCVIDAHEQVKTMESVFTVVSAMDRFGVPRRREPVIAFGGGVLTDIVGLATSLYRRSTPYVRVPTTLIGMIDAGIGAKTGVNFERHKNRLGTYHPSLTTLIDPAFLRTLGQRHISNGLAEILKIALVKDARLFGLLETHGTRLVEGRLQSVQGGVGKGVAEEVLQRAIHGMLEELQPNLWEHQLRRIVDYGHSFSPLIEMNALPELLHGEAVGIDMAFSTALAHRRGLVTGEQQSRIRQVMRALGLPLWHRTCTPELMARALDETVMHRDGRQHIPLPDGIGFARFVDDLGHTELAAALADLAPRGSMARETT
jgi:3-dehydroquinate synthase